MKTRQIGDRRRDEWSGEYILGLYNVLSKARLWAMGKRPRTWYLVFSAAESGAFVIHLIGYYCENECLRAVNIDIAYSEYYKQI